MSKKQFTIYELIDDDEIRALAGTKYYERGEDYYRRKTVKKFQCDGKVAKATVSGTHPYIVKLWVEGNSLNHSCTCPLGDDGDFCKHCVAVSLACVGSKSTDGSEKTLSMEDVRTYLLTLDKKELVDKIIDASNFNDRLYNGLFMEAASGSGDKADTSTFKRIIDDAIDTGEFISWQEAYDYAQGIDNIIDSIEKLLKQSKATVVVELCEYALKRVERSLEHVDDSDGRMGDILGRLQDIHLAACRKTKPDSAALAERLFRWEISTELDTFSGAVKTYADALGEAGLAVYRELADAKWETVPMLKPGQDRFGKDFCDRYRITKIMEELAIRAKDVEQLVAVKSKDLSSARHFLDIAKIYAGSKQNEKALQWAEMGLKTFPKAPGTELREYLASIYHKMKRSDDALKLIWQDFIDSPSLFSYQSLKEHADKIKSWSSWREKALGFMRGCRCINPKIFQAAQRKPDPISFEPSQPSQFLSIAA